MNRNQRKTVVGLFGGISAGLFVIFLFILASSNRQKPEEDKEKESVLIFTATKFFGLDMPAVKNAFVGVCSQDIQDYCHLTSDPEDFDKADAVLYHQPEYNPEVHQYPRNRDQIQVMLSLESPHYYNIKFEPGFMNWTMTYRLDSDVPFPYAVMKHKKKSIVTDNDAIWTQKNHSLTAAWMVANCDAPNRRKELVEAAQLAGLNVDILGMCGKRLEGCDREAEDRYDCAARTLRHYKFYFALENTNCRDYVTEKFFNSLRIYKTVPIVIRREYYSNIGIPNDAFIALDDFDSMTDFVNYLDKVKANSTEYLKYHAWRDHYDVAEYDRTTGFCLLCEKLKQPSRQSRNYHDLHNWFSKDMCENNYADSYNLCRKTKKVHDSVAEVLEIPVEAVANDLQHWFGICYNGKATGDTADFSTLDAYQKEYDRLVQRCPQIRISAIKKEYYNICRHGEWCRSTILCRPRNEVV